MRQQRQDLANVLNTDSGIDSNYKHAPKRVTPGEALEVSGAVLKWYGVHPDERPVPGELTNLARSYLMKTALEAGGLGFVVLHRCGADFYFLIVNTWRNNNEIWETVFYKDGDAMPDFALFPREGEAKPTYCVWEFAPVWHEKEAWERFLTSGRDEAAAESWRRDLYRGPA